MSDVSTPEKPSKHRSEKFDSFEADFATLGLEANMNKEIPAAEDITDLKFSVKKHMAELDDDVDTVPGDKSSVPEASLQGSF